MAKPRQVKATTATSSPGIHSDDAWKAEDDARTLHNAAEIHMDRKRHGLAVKVGRKKMLASQRAFGSKRY